MSREITVSLGEDVAEFLRSQPISRELLSVVRKAGGDAIRAMRAEAKRRVRARVMIRAGRLANSELPLSFPRGARALDAMVWTLDVSGRPVPLGEYPRRQTRKGVSVEVRRGHRTLLEGAFLAKGRATRLGVFRRPGRERYPMGHKLGLSVADTMADGQIPRGVLLRGQTVFGAAFRRLFK